MYDIEKLRKVLLSEEYRVIDDNGKVLPPSNSIYKRISEVMGGNPSAKHTYIIVKNNRNDMYDLVSTFFGLSNRSIEPYDCSFEPNISMSKVMDKFDLTFSKKDWKAIKLHDKMYEDGRIYIIFQSGWSDIFANNIWKQFHIPCPWTFKNVKASRQKSTTYCRVRAKCTECNAKLICTLRDKPDNERNIIFKCIVKSAVPDYIHKKRRQLRGGRRVAVANKLIDTKTDAISYIRTEAKDLINFRDPYPPTLPKTATLRKAISETKDKRLGLTGSKSINNLINAKDTTHIGMVHKIGASPFFCYYWTKDQKLLYKLHL